MTGGRARSRVVSDEVTPPIDLRLVPAALGLWVGCLIPLICGVGYGHAIARVGAGGAAVVFALGCRRRPNGMRSLLVVALALLSAGSFSTALHMQRIIDSPVYQAAQRSRIAEVQIDIATDPQSIGIDSGAREQRYLIRGALSRTLVDGLVWSESIPVSMFASGAEWAAVVPGQRIAAGGTLRVDDFQRWPTVSLSTAAPPTMVTPAPWWQLAGARLRAQFSSMTARLDGDAAGLLPGIVLGDRAGISPALTQDAKITGLTHLLAVSGSHFALLCGAVVLLLRRMGPRTAAVGGLVFATALVVLVRPSPSVLRAAVMGSLMLAALVAGRTRSLVPALAAAVLVLLMIDPALAFDAGFALSVQATGAIAVLAPVAGRALRERGWPAGWAEVVTVPTVAHLATMPVIAALSGTVSVWAIPANVLVTPAVPLSLVMGAIAVPLATVWPSGAWQLIRVAAVPTEWIAWCAHRVAAWPVAIVPWSAGFTGIVTLTAAAFLLPWLFRFRRFRLGSLVVVLGVATLLAGRFVTDRWPPPGWLGIGCDVGQGDAFVLSAGAESAAVVIDTGPEPSATDRCLNRLGITSIPLLILTHLHADHVDGLLGVLAGRAVGAIAVGPGRMPAAAWDDVRATAHAAGIPVTQPRWGSRISVGAVRIDVLGPEPGRIPAALGPNDQSLVVMVHRAGLDMLFAGDVEEAGQRALLASGVPLRAQVLKLPHHGSAKLLPEFVAAVHPDVVLIGVGAHNDFGHPSPKALQLLDDNGIVRILRTDLDGDIGVTAPAGVIETAVRGASVIRARRRRSAAVTGRGSPPARPPPRPVRVPADPPAPGPGDGVRSTHPPPVAPLPDCPDP